MYSRIFEVLLSKAEELGAQLDPAKFFWDFETNLIPAIQGNFPNIRVQGCFFHFCQTVLRQVGRLGIRTDYMNNQEIRRKTLAFLPVNLVPAGFEIINVGTSNQLEALFRYFQREWLPTNKISLWNVHGVSMRINNYMEGWHNRMTKRARKHAPPGFLQLIIDEQGKTETMVQQIDDDYTREMGFVRRSAAYGVQQATASLSYIFTWRKAVARSILIFLPVFSCWGYRVFNPSSPAFLYCWHQFTGRKGMDVFYCFANHFERHIELSRSTQAPEENVESYSARLVSLSKQAFPTAGEDVQTQMAKDQLIRGVSNDRIRELLVSVEEKPLAEMLKLAGEEETVLNRMRSAIGGATVVHVNDRVATGKQCVGVAKSGSTAAAAEERAATALEEEEAEVSEALAVSVDCRQDIEKLVNEFRRMLTRSVQLKQPRTRTANPPSQQLAEAVCWKCGSSSHYRRSCPFSKTRRERRSPSTTGEQKPTQKTAILSVNKKWAVKLSGKVNGRSLKLLVDTGAAISLIREAELNMASNVRISKYGSRQIVAVNGERVETVGTAEVDINIGDKLLKRHLMIVARSLSHPCLLDIDFLRPRRALIDLGDNRIKLGKVWLKLESSKTQEDKNRREAQQECDICLLETVTLPAQTEMIFTGRSDRTTPKLVNNYSVMAACSLSRAAGGTVPVRLLNGTDRLITLFKDTKLGTYSMAYTTTSAGCEKEPPRTEPMNKYSDLIDNMLQLPRNIPNDIRKQLRALLWKYKQVIATDDYDTGRTNICKHSINTGDTPPIKQNPKRIPYHQKESPMNHHVGLGHHRLFSYKRKMDRILNHHTKKDAQLLPKIEETLETLSGATWFSTLHLASRYWQVEVADGDKEKTAFTTTIWVMPFGLCNAPTTFQRLMETVLCGLHWTTCMVYLDDIIVCNRTPGKIRRSVFTAARSRLKIKPTKCQLFQEKVKYLGHIVSRAGVQPDPEKIRAVEQWPTLRCAKELQQFFGLASYYRRFVKGFAQLGEPLHRLSEKWKQWNWTDQCEKAFAFLKTQLTKQPVLAHPNFKIPFVVDTDATGDELGAVLSQIIAGQERVAAFASCTLSKSERKYCATRREMLALVWELKQFRCFLYGRRFTVRTDHGSLMWLKNFKPEGQVARWLEQLAEFDFEVIHHPGRKHQNADALSREACKQCCQNTSTPCTAVSSIMGNVRSGNPVQYGRAQDKDQDIAQMRKWVANKTVPTRCLSDSSRALQSLLSQKDQMIIKDGILFRRRLAKHANHRAGDQFVVPQILRQEILHGLHSGPEGDHLGKKKNLWKVRQRFYCPDLSEDVADWCRKCQECSQRKNGSKRHQGQLQPYSAPYPMSRIGVDIIRSFQRTERGNRYILTVQDYFLK
ncbi:Retrovirus-related Pol polyprotein from transposon [Trichinella sp. T8]|nr:Retrovirus-related Pol polyprotein from transposon [Trichinella sp. T8]